jgi:hypothetical protein
VQPICRNALTAQWPDVEPGRDELAVDEDPVALLLWIAVVGLQTLQREARSGRDGEVEFVPGVRYPVPAVAALFVPLVGDAVSRCAFSDVPSPRSTWSVAPVGGVGKDQSSVVAALSTGVPTTTNAALTGTAPSGSKPPGKIRATPTALPRAGTVTGVERLVVQPSGPATVMTPVTGLAPWLTTVSRTSAPVPALVTATGPADTVAGFRTTGTVTEGTRVTGP